jgi:hypothetical protein
MGLNLKAFVAIFIALVGMNFARTKLDAMTWMPASLKRTDGIGLDDAVDAAGILGILYLVHKFV